MSLREPRNYKHAIDVLGGPVHVGVLCKVGRNAVSNWYSRGFPAEHHHLLGSLLRKAGYEVPPAWFKQTELAPKPPSPYPKRRPRKNQRSQSRAGNGGRK